MKPLTSKRIPSKRLIGLACLIVILIILPLVTESPYIIHLCIMACIYTVLGMTFSMQWSTGLITLGGAAFYSVGAYASTLLAMDLGLTFWLALPLATIITAVLALAVGAIIIRNPGMAFVVCTMIFSMVVVQTTGQIRALGAWGGFCAIPRPDSIGPIEFIGKTPYYYLALFLILVIAVAFYALYSSRIGRVWRAIKLSPDLARTLGINCYRYRLLAFVISSTAAGCVGSFYAHYVQAIQPMLAGGFVSIYMQLYAVLGGLNFYIGGPLIGAIIMTFVPEFMRVAKEVEPIITGVMLVGLIVFLPGGILGTIKGFPRFGWTAISERLRKGIKKIATSR